MASTATDGSRPATPDRTGKEQGATRWQTGTSGNPNGRPPGKGPGAKIRELISDADLKAIVKKLIEKAKDGDTQAARILLDRAIPGLKPIEPTASIELPDGSVGAGGLAGQGRAVMAAVASGALAPGHGALMVSALGALAKIIEVDELQRRITELEERTR